MTLGPATYLDHLRREGESMRAAASGVPLDTPVTSCPGWDVAELLRHTGGVHRWATAIVRSRSTTPVSRRDLPAAPGGDGLIEWFAEGLAQLLEVLSLAGPEATAWNWVGAPQTSAFWFRRQTHETAVHRWDTEAAGSGGNPLSAPLAVDGIDELLDLLVPRAWPKGEDPLGGSLHVHATDAEGEWTVAAGADGRHLTRGHGKGDAAVRGTASDLLLFLWGRPVTERVEVFGQSAIPARWREAVRL